MSNRKFIRGGWDIARLMLLSGALGAAIALPHGVPHDCGSFGARILGNMVVVFLLWPFYRWAVLQFEKDAA